jgi:hypothetical protein
MVLRHGICLLIVRVGEECVDGIFGNSIHLYHKQFTLDTFYEQQSFLEEGFMTVERTW